MEPTRHNSPTLFGLSPLTLGYLAASLIGLVGTWYCNIQFFSSDSDTGYFPSLFANWASSSIAIDIFVVAAAGVVFMVVDARRLGLRLVWLHVVATFLVAAAFSLPLFLARRQHHLDTLARARTGAADPAAPPVS